MTPAGTRPTVPARFARSLAPILVGAGGVAALAGVYLRDPHLPGSWGICPVLALTGLHCPGCGGLRAVHDLLHGHPVQALASNAMGLVLCAVLAGMWAGWLAGAWRGRPITWDRVATGRWAVVLLGLLAVFTVYRNTPWGGWLAPGA